MGLYILFHIAVLLVVMYIFLYVFKRKVDQFYMRLKQKHVVITGGSSGIGKAFAIICIKSGAHVTIIGRDVKKLLATQVELKMRARHRNVQVIRHISLDCTNGIAVEELLTGLDRVMPIYMLVNCAGVSVSGLFEEISIEDMKRMMEINFYGTVYPTRCLVPRMKERKEGIIVMTGSQASLLGVYGYTMYSATKFALRGFAESLFMEVKDYGIDVTLAVPHSTETHGYINDSKTKPVVTQLISDMCGVQRPDAVAESILRDSLNRKFLSARGIGGRLSATLCVGFSPTRSPISLAFQFVSLGFLRVIAIIYTFFFQNIVKRYRYAL